MVAPRSFRFSTQLRPLGVTGATQTGNTWFVGCAAMTKYKLSRFKDRDTRKVFGTILGEMMSGMRRDTCEETNSCPTS
jgi:hypothetical protein